MKHKILLFFLSLTLAATLGANTFAASAKNITVASLKFSTSSIKMAKGATFRLYVKINPSNAKTSLRWLTTNAAVATVSGNGTVSAKKSGFCTIVAKSSNNKTAKCAVTVKSIQIKIVSIRSAGVTTTAGTEPNLPSTVIADMSDGSTKKVSVVWTSVSSSKYANVGKFQVKGIVAGTSISATATVTVKASFYTDGKYKVGKDISAGEYVLIGTGTSKYNKIDYGTFQISSISGSGDVMGRSIVTLKSGESITIKTVKMYPIASAPKLESGGTLSEGMYKVGTDIAPGTYTLLHTNDTYNGYYRITKDSSQLESSTTKEDHFTDTLTVTLTSGQYITVWWGQLQPLMSDSDYISYLDNNYGSLTIGGQTVNFDWHMTSTATYEKGIYASIDSSDYKIWCNWLSNNTTSDISTFFNYMAAAVKQNYPGKTYIGAVALDDTFTTNPSSTFPSNDITANSDGTWKVIHVVAAFDYSNAPKIIQ